MIAGLVCALAGQAFARPTTAPVTQPVTRPSTRSIDQSSFGNDQYCGLWSVYAAAQLLGGDAEFGKLLDPTWVDGSGSSLLQLQAVAHEAGLSSRQFSAWTKYDLLACPYPVVLHVNSNPGQPRYQHWILWTGVHDDHALLVNGPAGVTRKPMAELSLVWDGRGLVLYPTDTDPWLAWPRWTLLVGIALAVTAVAWLAPMIPSRGSSPGARGLSRFVRRASTQATLIAVAAAGLAASQALLAQEGLLANPATTAHVADAHLPDFLPKLGFSEMRELVEADEAIVIDARLPQDYAAGHIPGAINVPVGRLAPETLALLRERAAGRRLVIYCESRWCEYDEYTARVLLQAGFSDLALFPGGWREWEGAQ